jgi:hypothetical protein
MTESVHLVHRNATRITIITFFYNSPQIRWQWKEFATCTYTATSLLPMPPKIIYIVTQAPRSFNHTHNRPVSLPAKLFANPATSLIAASCTSGRIPLKTSAEPCVTPKLTFASTFTPAFANFL